MKQCPTCNYNNEDNDLQCQKCNYVFNDTSKAGKDVDKNEDAWPSDEWKDWNLM